MKIGGRKIKVPPWFSSLIVFLLVAAFLLYFVEWELVLESLRQARWSYLVWASLALLAGYVIYAGRWRFLLDGKPKFGLTFHVANTGNLANTLLPVRPGDPMRVFMLAGGGDVSVGETTSSIVIERWLEQIMRLAALGGAMVFGLGLAVSPATILGSVAFLVGTLVFMAVMVRQREFILARFPLWLARLPRLTEETVRTGLERLLDGLDRMISARHLAGALVWSVLTWFFFWLFHFLCLLALRDGMGLDLNTMLAYSLGSLALVPPSATTLPGVYQLSMVVPLSLVGGDREQLTAYAVLMNLLEMFWIVVLGAWGAWASGHTWRKLLSSTSTENE